MKTEYQFTVSQLFLKEQVFGIVKGHQQYCSILVIVGMSREIEDEKNITVELVISIRLLDRK